MITPGLQRISRLLAHTSLPWRAIHVAGTNGKGSLCAYISAMLDVYNKSDYITKASLPKLRHGRFTSPHLIDRWDCISINGEPVAGKVFKAVEREVLQRDRDEKIGASEFEVLTATAFEIFNREKIDVGVVEVGMGGAEDATNVIGQPVLDGVQHDGKVEIIREPPLVTIISKIGLDHQAFLGNTLEEIARQKAGILKPKVPVIFDPGNAPEVKDVIRFQAKQRQSPIYEGDILPNFIPKKASNMEEHCDWGSVLACVGKAFKIAGHAHVPQHVLTNSTLALMAVNIAFHQLGCFDPLSRLEHESNKTLSSSLVALDGALVKITAHTAVPGRQQMVDIESLTGRRDPILLDGAHNADSANALTGEVELLRSKVNPNKQGRPITWVLAASDSKDATEIFRPLIGPRDTVVLVEFGPVDGMPWVKAMAVDKLEASLRALDASGQRSTLKVVRAGNDVLSALRQATKLAHRINGKGPLVVAGSLYLVGDVLRILRDVGKNVDMNRVDLAERRSAKP